MLLIKFASRVVTHIGRFMEYKSRRKVIPRLLSHREDEGIIADFHRRLDNLESHFTVTKLWLVLVESRPLTVTPECLRD
jgi:hypothetical protein